MDRDLEIHRLTARLRALRRFSLDLCLGRIVPDDGSEPVYIGRLGLTDRDRPAAARRLAIPRGGAVLRGDARQPDGAGEPPQVPLDRRPDQRLLGRGVHPGRVRGARRARRPVGVHRQPGRQQVGPDARRARHHPGRPGRDHPRRLPRHPGRRRRSGHRARRSWRCTARRTCSTPTRASARAAAASSSSGRTSPTWPTSRTCCPASARRACRPAPCATSCPKGPTRAGRARPGGGPAQGVRRHGEGDRAGGPALRGATDRRDGGRDPVERHLAQRRGLDRGVRVARARDVAQRGPRPGLGGAAHDPRGQARGRRGGLRGPGPPRACAERRAGRRLRPGLAADRPDRPGRRPVVGAGVPAPVCSLARSR